MSFFYNSLASIVQEVLDKIISIFKNIGKFEDRKKTAGGLWGSLGSLSEVAP